MEPAAEEASEPKLTLNLHAIIIVTQAENGLRHRDYRRYRTYLARRLQKVRRAAGVPCGKGRAFVKKEITVEVAKSVDHLMVLLLNAERSWSYAMELKEASTLDGQRKLKHVAVSRLSRAANWARQLRDLCQAKTDPLSALEATAYSDWMEGLLLMEREHWEEAIGKLGSAKVIYQELGKVGSLHDQDVFLTRLQDLDPPIRFCRFNSGSDTDLVDTDIFASSPDLSAKFDAIRAKKMASDVSAKTATGDVFCVRFAGAAIPVLDSDLRTCCSLVMAAVEKAIGQTTDGLRKDKDFTAALGEVDGALAAISKLSNSLNAAATSSASRMSTTPNSGKVGEMKSSLTQLKNFLNFQRLNLLLSKNKGVCQQLLDDPSCFTGLEMHSFSGNAEIPFNANLEAASAQRVHELAHLFDQRLDLLRDMQTIQGIKDHDLLKMELSTEEFVCRTLRACYIADCYVIERKWAESSALSDHAERLASTAEEKYANFKLAVESTEAIQADDMSSFLTAKNRLCVIIDSLQRIVSGTRGRHAALYALISALPNGDKDDDDSVVDIEDAAADDRRWSILSRPLQWNEPVTKTGLKKNKKGSVEEKTIVVDEIPSGFNAIPCKPVFFDIASNYIVFPDIDHRAGIVKKKNPRGDTADAADTASATTAGGIVKNLFGWFSG